MDQTKHLRPTARGPLFDSFFLAGFECSDNLLQDGRRLDLLASTRHDELSAADYARLRTVGMSGCRDGISWVRVEPRPGVFDFSSFGPRLRAARETQGLRAVIWDLMHFGYPEHVNLFGTEFPERFARFAGAVARFMADEVGPRAVPFFSLINEMSFFAWAAGDVKVLHPFALARGHELKAQLVLATIAGIETIRDVFPHARFLHAEPLINIVPASEQPRTWRKVECDNALQFEALDMLSGRVWPRLGGDPKYLDLVGVNYYPDNQFLIDGTTIAIGDARYKPLAQLLMDVFHRYGRPMIIAETGSEGDGRGAWLRYVSAQCLEALELGCELHGATLYPILDHAGWLDNRYCPNGLWGYADESGDRSLNGSLALEIARQEPLLCAARDRMLARRFSPNLDPFNEAPCDAY